MNSSKNNCKERKLEATITLKYKNPQTAKAIADAVSPDNFKTPPGTSVKTEQKANQVITQIKTQEKITTFLATIDDLLFCASTAEKTLNSIK